MNNQGVVILGIDPGLRVTGYGVLAVSGRVARVVEAGVIKSNPKASMGERLVEIRGGFEEILDQFRPVAMAMEQLFAHYKHPRTAIAMGHARGVLLESASRRGLSIDSITPRQAKKTITGSGSADKLQMQRAMLGELGLGQMPEPPDVADALALALCLHHRRLAMLEETK